MASGEAKKLHKITKLPVLITRPDGTILWSEMWENLDYICGSLAARQGKVPFKRQSRRKYQFPHTVMVNAGGARPYIAAKTPEKWTWRLYKPIPGEIKFSLVERAFGSGFAGKVMIEPHGKDVGHANKQWIWERWQALVNRFPLLTFTQCGPPGTRWLDGVQPVITPRFRDAAAVLANSTAFVGTEGGLMHAAAALGTPAVILWSEFIAPTITGYETMRNIRHAGTPCGLRVPCAGCKKSMEKITVDEVEQALREVLK